MYDCNPVTTFFQYLLFKKEQKQVLNTRFCSFQCDIINLLLFCSSLKDNRMLNME